MEVFQSVEEAEGGSDSLVSLDEHVKPDCCVSDSTFLIDRQYTTRKEGEGVVDDERGLVYASESAYQGYHSDADLSINLE
ncbi:unnamed protein product, partial [Ilex paraguariensis]